MKDEVHYLVKWAGWPSEYNSYEPAAHLANAPQTVKAFERRLKRKRRDDGDDDEDGPAPKARRRGRKLGKEVTSGA